jgi:hypothetical protein
MPDKKEGYSAVTSTILTLTLVLAAGMVMRNTHDAGKMDMQARATHRAEVAAARATENAPLPGHQWFTINSKDRDTGELYKSVVELPVEDVEWADGSQVGLDGGSVVGFPEP